MIFSKKRIAFYFHRLYISIKWSEMEQKTTKLEQSGAEVERMYGKYDHTVDAKGRLFVPSKLREHLGETFYVMPGTDTCLNVYSRQGWEQVQERINAIPLSKRRGIRFLLGNVLECSPDKQGRFLLTPELRQYASLEQEVTILGQGDHVEIWARDAYRAEEEEKLTPEYIRSVMEELEI